MDPVTACAMLITELLKYATEVRRTMQPTARDEFDRIILADIKWWRHAFGIDKETPK